MRIIGLASSKGGVGKTTASVHLAVALAGCGATVLLVDLDPQGAIGPSLGLPEVDPAWTSTSQLGGVIPPRVQCVDGVPGLMVLGARPDVDHLQNMYATGCLREWASRLRDVPDFVIVDLAPSMEPLTLWALNELDSVLVVVQATALSVRTIPTMLANLTHHCERTAVEGLLINHLGIGGQFGHEVAASIRQSFGEWVFPVEIPFDETIQRASLMGATIWGEKSPAAEAFRLAAAELIDRAFAEVSPEMDPERMQTASDTTGQDTTWGDTLGAFDRAADFTTAVEAEDAKPRPNTGASSWPLDAGLFDDGNANSSMDLREMRPAVARVQRRVNPLETT